MIDFNNKNPLEIAQLYSDTEIINSIKIISEWSSTIANAIDEILIYKIVRIHESNIAEIISILEIISKLFSYKVKCDFKDLKLDFHDRWQGYKVLLEEKINYEKNKKSNYDSLINNKQVIRILKNLEHNKKENKQIDIKENLNLGKSYLSQILTKMETCGLIRKNSLGKENLIRITKNGLNLLNKYYSEESKKISIRFDDICSKIEEVANISEKIKFDLDHLTPKVNNKDMLKVDELFDSLINSQKNIVSFKVYAEPHLDLIDGMSKRISEVQGIMTNNVYIPEDIITETVSLNDQINTLSEQARDSTENIWEINLNSSFVNYYNSDEIDRAILHTNDHTNLSSKKRNKKNEVTFGI